MELGGTERFEIRRRIGAGAMGIVYEAWDRERDCAVALKTLQHATPDAIYRFKREFRAMADIVHENLVGLYELTSAADTWFFTMELVDGGPLALRTRSSSGAPRSAASEPDAAYAPTVSSGSDAGGEVRDATAHAAVAWDELPDLLRQLARGLGALHGAGVLHRDIKPSNVLLDRGGRLVLVDFGLATELDAARRHRAIVGTIAYMAPEQAAGRPLSEASDWYAAGAMLYELLTGRLPFTGSVTSVLARKQTHDPPPPRALDPEVPEELAGLCMALMDRDPARRPTGDEVLSRLAGAGAAAPRRRARTSQVWIGRDGALAELTDAYERAAAGGVVAAIVRGPAGIGRTALVRELTRRLAARGDAVIARGRCHEREALPYKALDAAADELSDVLAALPDVDVEAVLPPHARALARLFPVLDRVPAIARAPAHAEPADPHEQRRLAFAAFAELLRRLARRGPCVLTIDDAQWSDADSAAVLERVLGAPDGHRLLIVATVPEPSDGNPIADALLAHAGDLDVRLIDLEPMSGDEARALAMVRVGDAERAARVAAEAAGNPLFVEELAREPVAAASGGEGLLLDAVLARRIARLPEPARRLLAVVAVAGGPIEQRAALAAAELHVGERSPVATLRTERLARTDGAAATDAIEAYHDRIRAVAARALAPDELRACHGRLAAALRETESAAPETIATHLVGAGEPEHARAFAADAAARADRALAFDRAARLYRWSLRLGAPGAAERARLLRGLAEALGNAGRSSDAADAYVDAAAAAGPDDEPELARRVVEQLFRAGRVDEGLDALAALMARVGMRMPRSTPAVAASLVWQRAALRAGRLRYTVRPADAIATATHRQMDALWTGLVGMIQLEPLRALDFAGRQLRLAMRTGDARHIAPGLAMEAVARAVSGAGEERTEPLLAEAAELAARDADPFSLAFIDNARGVAAYQRGRWARALEWLEAGIARLRGECVGAYWEQAMAQLWAMSSLFYLGRARELVRRAPDILRDAEERGDRFSMVHYRVHKLNAVWLFAGDPTRARAELEHAIAMWPRQRFLVQQVYYELLAHTHIDLYEGDAERAERRVRDTWPRVRPLLRRVHMLRIEGLHLRARAALACATAQPSRARELVKLARQCAARLDREPWPWAHALAAAIRARSPDDRATAASKLDALDMRLHAAALRRDLELLRAEAIREPERLAAMLAP